MGQPIDLREALGWLRSSDGRPDETGTHRVGIACGFTPLHLETFVRAYLSRRRPEGNIQAVTGIYGDLPGTIGQLAEKEVDSSIVVLEWPDLDPRLGLREAVGAPIADLDDIAETARRRLERIASPVQALGRSCRTAVALPTLGLPAAYDGRRAGLSTLRARLNLLLAEFTEQIIGAPGIEVVSADAIAATEAVAPVRRDLRTDIRSGFPYSIGHASALAQACVDVLVQVTVKKGLITDLDDTLWRGLVGEIGPESVTWDLDSGSQTHALYQQLLAALSSRGTLVAVASKNDPAVAQQALRREDLLVSTDMMFPVEVSWDPKSLAVEAILRAWNVAASDVVFVDDSPMELAEVAAQHPNITTVLFPGTDPNAVAVKLNEIAALLWRETVNAEDTLRLSSLRSAREVEQTRSVAQDERSFLRDLAGRITIRVGDSWQQPRTLELVNKTNQFNLNGRRFDEGQWRKLCTRPGAIVQTIAYEDRFGPLGVISVLAGVRTEQQITVDCWVLSCRAFSRAIEDHVLRHLCEGSDRVVFDLEPTTRNGVLLAFLDRVAPANHHAERGLDPGALQEADIHDVLHDPEDEIEQRSRLEPSD